MAVLNRLAATSLRRCAVLLSLCCACTAHQLPTSKILALRLTDGRMIQDALPTGRVALLVYDVSYCFACSSHYSYWRALQQAGTVDVAVLIAGDVSSADLRALRLQRIPVVGVLRTGQMAASSLPSEYLLVDQVITASAEGVEAVGREKLWRRYADTSIQALFTSSPDTAGRYDKSRGDK